MTVGVVGAGTMGIGIAQVAAQAGHGVVLYDAREDVVHKAITGMGRQLEKLVEKGRMSSEEVKAITGRIKGVNSFRAMAGAGLIIEAIIEDIDVKRRVFEELEGVAPEAVLATNTSSLAITAIAAACARPERVIGLHFFNPAPLLQLVEVIPGIATDPALPARIAALMKDWGKEPVIGKDTPGFIVNRVARPFYGESIRILEEGIADIPTIDRAMKELGGFRMGPFELMDLIGNDVNLTVTRTVWQSFFYDPRYKPSFTQQRHVEAGWLGRKSGRGYYHYADGAPATSSGGSLPADAYERIVWRVLVMLINEAADAVHLGVADRTAVDLAMTKGVNYPKGLLRWADELGLPKVLGALEGLQAEYGEDRYRPSPLLRRLVREGRSFHG